MVAETEDVTDVVLTLNVALTEPWGTVTLCRTVALELLLDSVTTVPPAGAAELSVTEP
jgi:hypothetical protein